MLGSNRLECMSKLVKLGALDRLELSLGEVVVPISAVSHPEALEAKAVEVDYPGK